MPAHALRSIAVVVVAALAAPALADTTIDGAHVAAALTEAGDNRAELQSVLDHYAKSGDAEKLTAARFLIANMPGKGYIETVLRTAEGDEIAYDPVDYENLEAAQVRLETLEKEYGELSFDRGQKVDDVRVITAAYLTRHIDLAFDAWRATPDGERVDFDTFLTSSSPTAAAKNRSTIGSPSCGNASATCARSAARTTTCARSTNS